MKILGLITARGGSKGVPRKNIRSLCGKPLLAYTAESALAAKELDRVILSTEDEEIAEVGRNFGLDVPFMRPEELAQDNTPSLPVVLHALMVLERQDEQYEAVCLLQPTNPLRRAEDIDGCVKMFKLTSADSVVSVLPVPTEYNPKWVYWLDGHGRLTLSSGEKEPIARRQDLPSAFHRDGSIYVTQREVIFQRGSLYGSSIQGYVMDSEYSANIDSEEDWKKVEEKLKEKLPERILCAA